jgi:hypothetical protein
MTAWVKAGTREEVGVITDYTDPAYVLICVHNDFPRDLCAVPLGSRNST